MFEVWLDNLDTYLNDINGTIMIESQCLKYSEYWMFYHLLHDILATKDNLNLTAHVHSKNVMSTSQCVYCDMLRTISNVLRLTKYVLRL